MNTPLQITQGYVRINSKRVKTPNYMCTAKDVISLTTTKGVTANKT